MKQEVSLITRIVSGLFGVVFLTITLFVTLFSGVFLWPALIIFGPYGIALIWVAATGRKFKLGISRP